MKTTLYVVKAKAHVWYTTSVRRLAAILTVLSESTEFPKVGTREVSQRTLTTYSLS
jgi:hypothetical protein